MEPASIRTKNPGAMWGSALAKKWGSNQTIVLHDGKGQGNNIAVFPTYVQGICAQLDLWRTSPHYKNKRFADAIAVWSGHNNVLSYIDFCKKRIPGLTENTVMNDAFWRSPMGVAFLKAQAWHEAGKQYPAPDADWIEAQRRVMGGKPVVVGTVAQSAIVKPADHAKVGGAVIVATSAAGAAAASQSSLSALDIIMWIAGLSLVAVAAFIIGFRVVKGHWPWTSILTGNQSPELSPLSPQSSAPSLEDLSQAQSVLRSAASPAAPLPASSVSKPRRKQSAKPSQKTRTQRAKSSKSKTATVTQSSRKPGRNSKKKS